MEPYRIQTNFVSWAKEMGYTFQSQKEESIFQKQILELSKSGYAPMFTHLMKYVKTPKAAQNIRQQQYLSSLKEQISVAQKNKNFSIIDEENMESGLNIEQTINQLEKEIKLIKADFIQEENIRDELLRSISEIRQRRIYLLNANSIMNEILSSLEKTIDNLQIICENESKKADFNEKDINTIESTYLQLSESVKSEFTVCKCFFLRIFLFIFLIFYIFIF